MAPPSYDTTGIEHFSIDKFSFSTGETLPVTIAYRSFNPSAQRIALIPTCFKGRINTTLNFSTTALKDHHVIVVAMLGNGESSSPSNTPDGLFPKAIHYQDNIAAQYILLTQHLHVTSLDAVIGFSMGGQQAYYWGVLHGSSPEPFVRNIVTICSSAKTSYHNIAFLEGPIAALSASGDYAHGAYRASNVRALEGVRAFGRAYAGWLTSSEWFRRELWKELGKESFAEWLTGIDEGYEDWDPENLLVLARMWQAGDLGAVGGGGDWKKALSEINARVLVMPSRTDQYFTPDQSERELECLKNGELSVIETVWGHIAGGGANKDDTKWMGERIGRFLSG